MNVMIFMDRSMSTGKYAQSSFPKEKVWRASNELELVHIDVCGSMRTLFLDGNKYFILLIDDYSKMNWVYFMKERS